MRVVRAGPSTRSTIARIPAARAAAMPSAQAYTRHTSMRSPPRRSASRLFPRPTCGVVGGRPARLGARLGVSDHDRDAERRVLRRAGCRAGRVEMGLEAPSIEPAQHLETAALLAADLEAVADEADADHAAVRAPGAPPAQSAVPSSAGGSCGRLTPASYSATTASTGTPTHAPSRFSIQSARSHSRRMSSRPCETITSVAPLARKRRQRLVAALAETRGRRRRAPRRAAGTRTRRARQTAKPRRAIMPVE